jgi:hypothetical protein
MYVVHQPYYIYNEAVRYIEARSYIRECGPCIEGAVSTHYRHHNDGIFHAYHMLLRYFHRLPPQLSPIRPWHWGVTLSCSSDCQANSLLQGSYTGRPPWRSARSTPRRSSPFRSPTPPSRVRIRRWLYLTENRHAWSVPPFLASRSLFLLETCVSCTAKSWYPCAG